MNRKAPTEGDRVLLSPDTDLWKEGDKYGRVLGVTDMVTVRMERTLRVFVLHMALLTVVGRAP